MKQPTFRCTGIYREQVSESLGSGGLHMLYIALTPSSKEVARKFGLGKHYAIVGSFKAHLQGVKPDASLLLARYDYSLVGERWSLYLPHELTPVIGPTCNFIQ